MISASRAGGPGRVREADVHDFGVSGEEWGIVAGPGRTG